MNLVKTILVSFYPVRFVVFTGSGLPRVPGAVRALPRKGYPTGRARNIPVHFNRGIRDGVGRGLCDRVVVLTARVVELQTLDVDRLAGEEVVATTVKHPLSVYYLSCSLNPTMMPSGPRM